MQWIELGAELGQLGNARVGSILVDGHETVGGTVGQVFSKTMNMFKNIT
jgi:hypothetical protein